MSGGRVPGPILFFVYAVPVVLGMNARWFGGWSTAAGAPPGSKCRRRGADQMDYLAFVFTCAQPWFLGRVLLVCVVVWLLPRHGRVWRSHRSSAVAPRVTRSTTSVPAVMAVLGRRDVVEGTDYRCVRVLAALTAVPDSPLDRGGEGRRGRGARGVARSAALLIVGLVLAVTAHRLRPVATSSTSRKGSRSASLEDFVYLEVNRAFEELTR